MVEERETGRGIGRRGSEAVGIVKEPLAEADVSSMLRHEKGSRMVVEAVQQRVNEGDFLVSKQDGSFTSNAGAGCYWSLSGLDTSSCSW